MNADAIAKIKMLKGSLHCLAFGLLSLLPIIGLPFALVALWISGSVRRQEKRFWNAARPYRLCGVACAAISAILWSGILIFVVGHLLLFDLNG
ncbi:MAG TPA: hypothetical protein VHG71_01375 [Verrucomicrobiae bacterium]|nr:hypothetical protein [Verrucomicrobiae bacterium]